MSFHDNNDTWPSQSRQASWEHQQGRSANPVMTAAEPHAFAAQFEEIERAADNLSRSGKWFAGVPSLPGSGAARRDSTSSMAFNAEQRMQRHPSNSNLENANQPGAPYQGQRFPSKQSEAEQMLYAKRRMAAQRERELRNYHQEQQYNRNTSTTAAKSDRSQSPNTMMTEEDRRDLIARQHRALYGDNSNLYNPDGQPRAKSQDVRAGGRDTAPPAGFEYNSQAQGGADAAVQMPPRGRTESTVSPVGQQTLETQRTTTTSPTGGSPPHQSGVKGVAPIGTRTPQGIASLNKRATTPLTPSSLGYGYSSHDSQAAGSGPKEDRSTSALSNSSLAGEKGVPPLGGSTWGNNSGVWGKSSLNSQASVWG